MSFLGCSRLVLKGQSKIISPNPTRALLFTFDPALRHVKFQGCTFKHHVGAQGTTSEVFNMLYLGAFAF